jgi:hypothetical protein
MNFHALLSIMDRINRQNINREIEYLHNTLNKQDIKDIYKTFQQTMSGAYSTKGHIISR